MKVLVITSLLPIREIDHKKNENDILLTTEKYLKDQFPDVQVEYLFIVPYSNFFISIFSRKWKSYNELKNKGKYYIHNKRISIFPVLLLPRKTRIRRFLYDLSIMMNRKKINNLLKEYNPDLIHAQHVDIEGYVSKSISLKNKIPYITTLRGVTDINDKLVKDNLRKSKSLISINKYHQEVALAQGLSSELIPHGVSPEFYVDDSQKVQDTNELKFVSVARLVKGKNIDLLIKTLSNVKLNYTLTIYGDGPELEYLNQLITEYNLKNKITILGQVDNQTLSKELRYYSVFVLPSISETFGRVYLEAMASGLPVIACKDTGIDGVVRDGVEGFLIEKNDESELKNKIERFLGSTQLIKDMSKKSIDRSKEYNWKSVTKKIYNYYTKAILE